MPGEIRARATFLNSCPRVTASDQLKTCSAELPCKSARRIYKATVSVSEAFLRRISFPGRRRALVKHCRNLAMYLAFPIERARMDNLRDYGAPMARVDCKVASIGFRIARRTENLTYVSFSLYFIQNLGSDAKRARVKLSYN